MDTNTIAAIGATATAVFSLLISVHQGRTMIQHNRQSVRPLLQLRLIAHTGEESGIRLINCGLGPAIVTGSSLKIDDQFLGEWSKEVVDALRHSFFASPGKLCNIL